MRNFLGQRALPQMEYHRPKELEQVFRLLGEFKGRCKIIAGGTDLIPAVRRGALSFPGPVLMIDISSIKELNFIRKEEDTICIGAITRLAEIGRSNLIREYAPVLAQAISQMSSLQVRNVGTIGGNLCNASPAADTAPPLLVLEAIAKVRSLGQERMVPLKEFFLGPSRTMLGPEEILAEIHIPMARFVGTSSFIKLGRRNTFTLSIVTVATLVKVKDGIFKEVRIALGAVAPTPIRASKTEGQLIGKRVDQKVIDDVVKVVISEVKPIDDVRASAEYRRDMSYILTKRAIQACLC